MKNQLIRILFLFLFSTGYLLGSELPQNKPLDERLKAHINFEKADQSTIGYITVNDKTGQISQSTWIYVKKALDYYKEKKPAFIILELNTPGGEVFAAQQISQGLKEIDTQYNIPVVAFINNWAISAGAMLAYSSRFIAVVKDASMGAAAPVLMGEGGEMKLASEKVNSAIRTDFANLASFYDRNPLIAEAMVDQDLVLVIRDGKVVKLSGDDQIEQNTDIIITPKGKLLTLNAEQMMQFRVADILLAPSQLSPITPEESARGKWAANKMLLMTAPEFKPFANATIDHYQMDWKTQFFVFLTTPMVASLLFLGLIIGFYIEVSHPGFGLPGTVALTCLFLIVISSFALEIGNWLEVIFLFTGLILLIVELFVVPTFGVLGVIGIVLFLGGLLGLMVPGIENVGYEYDTKTLNAAGEVLLERLGWFSGTIVLAFLMIVFLAKYLLPKTIAYNRFVLFGNEQEASKGFIASSFNESLIGKIGIVSADLKPGGYIQIEGRYYPALSAAGYIEKGEEVLVVDGQGDSFIVKKIEKGS